MSYKWIARFGVLEEIDGGIAFPGGTHTTDEGKSLSKFGNFLCNARFSNGAIRASIEFEDTTAPAACGFIVRDNPETGAFLTAGFNGNVGAFGVTAFDGRQWQPLKSVGTWESVEAARRYLMEVRLVGTRLSLLVDEVLVLETILPGSTPSSQIGIWCQSQKRILVRDFAVESAQPAAFVIMQFSQPYNDLYSDVIKPVCAEYGIQAVRADDIAGPGCILADVIRKIVESSIIIAEITPDNPNVFYEVGFAHALNKPTILIADAADRHKSLPFDVSGFRTVFYENSIGGKRHVEVELRRHLLAIVSQRH